MAGATAACNSGNITLSTGQRPGNTDGDRELNSTKDNMMGATGGGVWHVKFTVIHKHGAQTNA